MDTVLPLFAEFLSVPSEQFPPPAMSPFAKRQRIMESLIQALLYKLSNEPSLFIIEDLHWADASTLEWLNLFMKQISTRPIFTLCTTRPPDTDRDQPEWDENPNVSYLTLQRLSVDNMMEICNHQTRGKLLPEEILAQITTKTEGVPLFVEELTKMILESDLIVEKGDGFEMTGSLSSLAIPSTLQDSLLARLDRLSDVKEIVQVGSVIGREFSLDMLNAVLPEKADGMGQSLSKLLDAEIFNTYKPGEQLLYKFKHALIQDAAYESLLKSRRQELHNLIAHVLENQFTNTAQTQPELLAHHYTEAGQAIQAIPLWLQAGQMASQKNATAEAISHLEKGLELLTHIDNDDERNNLELDFRLTLGGTFVVSHGFPHPKVRETFNKARDIAQQLEVSPKLALVLFNLLGYYMNTEDYDAQRELSDYMMQLAKDPEHGYWFELLAGQLVGGASIITGDFKKALKSYQRTLDLFDPSLPFPWELAPSGYLEIGSKAWLMMCLQILGYMDQAKSLSDEHLDYANNHKDSMTLYHIYTFPALYALEAREWKDAENIIEQYFPIVRAFGDPIFTLTAEVYYYIAKAYQGDKTAFDTSVNLINVCFDIGFRAFAVTLSPYIGEQFLRIGEYESALSWTEKILHHVNTTGSHIRTAELFRIKGLILQELGKPDEIVEGFFNQALELSRKQLAKPYELRASRDLARLWQKQGKMTEAFNLLNGIYNWFNEGFESVDLKEARELLDA
jgi:tetratricopeptide (TPR) repeat protein